MEAFAKETDAPMQPSAKELSPSIQVSGNQSISAITDNSYHTAAVFAAADTIEISAKDGDIIDSIYILWDAPVSPYIMITDKGTLECGQYGYLHEFLAIEGGSRNLTIHIPADGMKICGLRIFSGDTVPEDVQIWQPPCSKADIMLISSHADDEILFMGGIIPTYGAEKNAAVQVVYMTEYWMGQHIREHEKLDGLWTDGLRNYPVCGNFPDIYAENLAEAEEKYDLTALTDYLTDTLRSFRPQIVVTHDFNGEYGHGFHQLTAKAVSLALDAAADRNCRTDTESFALYGSWDVPKAYFHLYPENAMTLDLRAPLASMGGRTALEVAEEAYKRHVSQQWCWFYVSDSYKYSCADFGLYRTQVGADTSNDMLEHIVTYGEQERLEQEERKKREKEERERQETQERLAAREQALKEQSERERLEKERLEQEELLRESQRQAEKRTRLLCVLFACISASALAIALFLRLKKSK